MALTKQQSSKDGRRYPRIPKEVSIEIQKLEYPLQDSSGDSGTSRDITLGGICITAPNHYPPGTILNLNIKLIGWRRHLKSVFAILDDTSATAPLKAIAEVVWAKTSSTSAHPGPPTRLS